MKFTTNLILKKDKPVEKYDYPVLTQHSYNVEDKGAYTKFELNKAAMEEFGFTPNTPNVNKINWGVDEDTGSLLLANTKGLVEEKLSQITAGNTFANLSFMDKLMKIFPVDPLEIHEFKLTLQEDDNGIVVASLELMNQGRILATANEVEDNIDKFNETVHSKLEEIISPKEEEKVIW